MNNGINIEVGEPKTVSLKDYTIEHFNELDKRVDELNDMITEISTQITDTGVADLRAELERLTARVEAIEEAMH